MNPLVAWGMAAAAVAAGWIGWGAQGLLLALTVIVFWLLLQFSRVMRVMRRAGQRPVGRVGSAVMLHARLARGMKLLDILPIAGSLGRKVGDDPEAFEWADDSGAAVRVELNSGRLSAWSLIRDAAQAGDGGDSGDSPSPLP